MIYDTDDLLNVKHWTNDFYNNAYDIVKDRLFPIVIPSYNRPDNTFLKWYEKHHVPGYEYPIYIVVRQSQKEMYEQNDIIDKYDNIFIKTFPDEAINDLGKTREQIVNAFSKKYDHIFMFDDDTYNFCHSVPKLRNNGWPKSQVVHNINFGKTIAMWQIAHEYAVKTHDIVFSTGMHQAFCWPPENCQSERSLKLMAGVFSQTICVNLNKLNENSLNYRTNINNGHEDFDLLIRCLENRLKVVEFRWFTYAAEAMKASFLNDTDTLEMRFTKQQAEMKNNFGHLDYIDFKKIRGFNNVRINWRKLAKMYKNENIIDVYDNKFFDLWRDGQLLEDAKNNYINI